MVTISYPSTQKLPHTKFVADVEVEEMFFMERKHWENKELTTLLIDYILITNFCALIINYS